MPAIGSYAGPGVGVGTPPPDATVGAGTSPDLQPGTVDTGTTPIDTGALPGTTPSNLNINGILNGITGSTGLSPSQMAALAGAGQMYSNAGQFDSQSQTDAAYLDPAQQFQTGYGQQLQNLEQNPSAIANTPGYQFALSQGLGAVGRSDMASKGDVPTSDDIAFASGLAQQTYNSQVAQLTQLSGANFSPQSAASILQTGMLGGIGSQTAAMNDIFGGLFPPQTSPTGTPLTSGSPVTFSPGSTTTVPGGTNNPNYVNTGGTPVTLSPGQQSWNTNNPPSYTNISQGPGDQTNVPNNTAPDYPTQIDYTVNTDNGGSMFDPSMLPSMSP